MKGLRGPVVAAALLAVVVTAAGCRRRSPEGTSGEAAAPAGAAAAAKPSRVRVAVREEETRLLRAADRVRAFRVTESARSGHGPPNVPEGPFARGLNRLGVSTDVTGAELPADVAQKVAALLLREESWPVYDPEAHMDHGELIDPKYAFWLESAAGVVAVLWDPGLAQVQIRKVPADGEPEIEVDFTGEDFAAAKEIQALLQECLPVAPPEEDHTR